MRSSSADMRSSTTGSKQKKRALNEKRGENEILDLTEQKKKSEAKNNSVGSAEEEREREKRKRERAQYRRHERREIIGARTAEGIKIRSKIF